MSERPCEYEHEYSTSSGPVMYVNDEGELVEAEEAHAVDEQHVHDDDEEDVEDEPQLPGQGTAQGNSSVAASTREPVFSRPTVVDWYHIPEEQIDTLQCDCRCHSGPPHFADRSFSNRNTQGYWGGRIYVRFRGWHKGCQNFAEFCLYDEIGQRFNYCDRCGPTGEHVRFISLQNRAHRFCDCGCAGCHEDNVPPDNRPGRKHARALNGNRTRW